MFFLLLSILTYAISIVLIALVIMQRKEPTATLAWVLTIIFLPGFGAIFYLWFGFGRIERRVRERQRSNERLGPSLHTLEPPLINFKIVPENNVDQSVQTDLVKVAENIGAFPVTRGNSIKLVTDPEAVFADLEEAIK